MKARNSFAGGSVLFLVRFHSLAVSHRLAVTSPINSITPAITHGQRPPRPNTRPADLLTSTADGRGVSQTATRPIIDTSMASQAAINASTAV